MGRLQPPLPDALTHVKAIIIGCADMRVDPAHILDLKPGEAVVLRNIGGRVTPGLLAQLGMLGRIGAVAGKVPGDGGELNVIVLQHTDCGITRLADESAMLGQYFQVDCSRPARRRGGRPCNPSNSAGLAAGVAPIRTRV
jgi:carbonic anhydrase